MANNSSNDNNSSPTQKMARSPWAMIWMFLVGILLFQTIASFLTPKAEKISASKFYQDILLTGDVSSLILYNGEMAEVVLKPESLSKYNDLPNGETGPHYQFQVSEATMNNYIDEARNELDKGQMFAYDFKKRTDIGAFILSWILPLLIFVAIWIFIMRRMRPPTGPGGSNIFDFGKSKATLFEKGESKITFNDVAGLDEVKVEVREIVDFLKNPEKYTRLGAKIPKGVLLVGPPGTGKTLLAKAVAGEAGVPFYSISGSEFVEMFVGVGASRVRDLFKKAKQNSPSIIFIDEIDAIGRSRGKAMSVSSNDEKENTLNQMLTEMDGFGANTGVIVMAATNRGEILDRALLRPGRFDRQIYLDLPTKSERLAIFEVHTKSLKMVPDIDLDQLSAQTPGFAGADIANICNEAALIAARHDKNAIDMNDFMSAIDRVVAGLEKKSRIISDEERKTIAYHEAGHATASWFLPNADTLLKVSIVPRGRSLGAAWYLPQENVIVTKDQFMDRICATLGGRVAEDIFFGKVSSGALDDLEKITKQAYTMVAYYGLNEKIGNISFYDSNGQYSQSFQKPYSEATAQLIDQEVRQMVEDAYEKTKALLIKHRDKLEELAQRLLEKEVILQDELVDVFGERPEKVAGAEA